MDKLKGIDALGVVYTRVSDGCEVIKCILEFYKEMADVERTYALRISKLCQSTNYTFHSNILSQWLGSDPFEEIGTLKHCWQNLGNELLKLASLHDEKSESFHEEVRQPLVDILPELLEDRRELRLRKNELENNLKIVNKRFQKLQKSYYKQGDTLTQLRSQSTPTGVKKLTFAKLPDVEKEFKEMETQYEQCYRELVDAHVSLDEEVNALLMEINQKELNRVNKVAKSLQEFSRTLSNTVPAYLEGMQRIVMSVEEINGEDDIQSFVASHSSLQHKPPIPQLEYHPISLSSESNTLSEDLGVSENAASYPPSDNSTFVTPMASAIKPAVLPKPTDKNLSSSLDIPNTCSDESQSHGARSQSHVNMSSSPLAHSTTETTHTNKKRSTTIPVDKPVVSQRAPVVKIVGKSKKKTSSSSTASAAVTSTSTVIPIPKPSIKPKPVEASKDEILARLLSMAQTNNYYSLLGVPPDASKEDLARARREVTAKLHPDHFTGNPDQQIKANEKLVQVNQAFHDVLNKDESKKLYDQLCRFREKYHLIEKQERRGLESAKVRLSVLHSSMKKARCPLPLLNELQLSLQLIDLLLDKIP